VSSVLFDLPGPRARRRHRVATILTLLGLALLLAAAGWRLATQDQFTMQKWEPFVTPRIVEVLLQGLVDTLRAAVLAITFAVGFGLVFGPAKLSNHRVIRWPAWLVVEFFRAVPLLMLIVALFAIYSNELGSFWCLVIGLTLYNGSVLAEVFRAGINAVPKGQSEAAYAIGMRKKQVMNLILLPQAITIMLPAIVSQCVVVLKDTSLGYAILAPGLTSAGRLVWGEFQNRFATAVVLATIYIVLNSILTRLAVALEARLSRTTALARPAGYRLPTGEGAGGGAGA
jgi:glutamate transport system permease protein